jgi:hypothetical protein
MASRPFSPMAAFIMAALKLRKASSRDFCVGGPLLFGNKIEYASGDSIPMALSRIFPEQLKRFLCKCRGLNFEMIAITLRIKVVSRRQEKHNLFETIAQHLLVV